ncbi:MAG: hypothetical protein GC149_11385 [Gammaproteobacteria bacterium]|nr:hypothetical protein [Gammaproteobacteria bacterium]
MKIITFILFLILLQSCTDDGHLRGAVEPSKDGKTYFGVIDNNGGKCGPLLLDGKPWKLPIGQVALIEPGEHVIQCGANINFTIPRGVIYKFDYWGP